jgi:glycosyltransferase involved in cell wall biosynthesis
MIAVSEATQRALEAAQVDVPGEVIPNGLDVAAFRDVAVDAPALLRAVGQPEGAKIIGWAGRLGEEKNWRLFLQLAAALSAEREDVVFWLAGGGESHGGGDRLRAAMRDYPLAERLRWFPVLDYGEMPRFYHAIAASGGVFTLTSRQEAFGMVLLPGPLGGLRRGGAGGGV